MKISHYILSLGFLAVTNIVTAQDLSVADKRNYELERTSLLNKLRLQGTAHPALRQYRYQYSGTDLETGYSSKTQDVYNLQQGSGDQGLTISSSSYARDFLANTTIWGQAEYNSSTVKNLSYNESLDYARIAPYFLADSVGGDLKMERYRFGGGIVRSFGSWNIGSALNIDAKQGYRSSDPRPNNTSTALGLNFSMSREINQDYLLSVSVHGELFKEKDILNFVGSLGNPLIINLNGLGSYNNLLTGTGSSSSTRTHANFTTKTIETSVQLMPTDPGLWLSLTAAKEYGDKTIPRAFEAINRWEEQKTKLVLGYDGQLDFLKYVAVVEWKTQRRKGDEGLFTSSSGKDYDVTQISRVSSYRYYNDEYSGSITLGMNKWNARLHGTYVDMLEQYAAPFRTQKNQQIQAGIDLQYFKPLGYNSVQLVLRTTKTFSVNQEKKFNGIEENSGIWNLLNNNFDFLTREPLYIQPTIRWGLPTISQLNPYISANMYYATDINQKGWEMKIGLVF